MNMQTLRAGFQNIQRGVQIAAAEQRGGEQAKDTYEGPQSHGQAIGMAGVGPQVTQGAYGPESLTTQAQRDGTNCKIGKSILNVAIGIGFTKTGLGEVMAEKWAVGYLGGTIGAFINCPSGTGPGPASAGK